MSMDGAVLSRLWDEQWPGCPKAPYELRGVRERWVRFHTLPDSKRYPESEAEQAVVLARHNAVLGELVSTPAVVVVTTGYSESRQPQAPHLPAGVDRLLPEPAYWTSSPIDEEPGFESWMHLHVSEVSYAPGALNSLLRAVAGDEMANVLITHPELRWLYHPYDGGMDVLLPSSAERDVLRARHLDWLSTHPQGL